MAEKRKDKNGRILKTGENQRKNGTYDYRYTGTDKKVRCVYAKTLEELRRKEEIIQRDKADGIDYAAGEIIVSELIDRYVNLKRDWRENTRRAYGTAINRIKEDAFGQMKVRLVKPSDAKASISVCTIRAANVIPSLFFIVFCVRLLKWRWMMILSVKTRLSFKFRTFSKTMRKSALH